MLHSSIPSGTPFFVLFLSSIAVGCAGAPAQRATAITAPSAATVPTAPDPAELPAKLARWRSWEPKELGKHQVRFPDVGMSAELEAVAPPQVQCRRPESEGMVCEVQIALGKDDDGDARSMGCTAVVLRSPLLFGLFFKGVLEGRTIEEIPKLAVEQTAHGASARLLVPSHSESQAGTTSFGTTKIALAYGPGYTLACADNDAGASAAFERIAKGFFASATFDEPVATSVLRAAYTHRKGDAIVGFSLADVFKDDGGYSEYRAHFDLETDEKTWKVHDGQVVAERDTNGKVDSLRSAHWIDGGTPIVLTAKPSEAGRLRLKLEAGPKSDSLEITPRAPLSTELWEAPALARVSAGTSKGHRYGFLGLSQDGEPTVLYAALSRAKRGLLVEEIDHAGDRKAKKKKASDANAVEKNEISLDDRGFATKQVSAETISERIFVTGELPSRSRTPARGRRRAP